MSLTAVNKCTLLKFEPERKHNNFYNFHSQETSYMIPKVF